MWGAEATPSGIRGGTSGIDEIARSASNAAEIAATVEQQCASARRGGCVARRRGGRGADPPDPRAIDAVASQAASTADGSRRSEQASRVMGEAAARVDAIVGRYRIHG